CGWDCTIRSWNVETGAQLKAYDLGSSRPNCIIVSRDGRVAIVGDQDDRTIACELESGAVSPLYSHAQRGEVLCLALDPKMGYGFAGGHSCSVHIWEIGGGGIIKSLRHDSSVYGAVHVPDSTKVVTVASDEQVRLWDPTEDKPEAVLKLPHDWGRCLAAGPT